MKQWPKRSNDSKQTLRIKPVRTANKVPLLRKQDERREKSKSAWLDSRSRRSKV